MRAVPENREIWGLPLWDGGVVDTLETRYCSTYITTLNSIALGHAAGRNYGNPPENFDRSRPAFQGH